MAGLFGKIGWSFPVIGQGGCIGSVAEKQLDEVKPSGGRDGVKGREPALLSRVYIRAAPDDGTNDLDITVRDCCVDGRYFESVCCGLIDVGAGVEEIVDNSAVAEKRGQA
jgi:hypothetical protein